MLRNRSGRSKAIPNLFTFVAGVLLCCHSYRSILIGVSGDDTDPTRWYKRYVAYPLYCSTPDQMAQRHVPALHQQRRRREQEQEQELESATESPEAEGGGDDSSSSSSSSTSSSSSSSSSSSAASAPHYGATKLAHVTAVVRHGARTPVASENMLCWQGYQQNPETAVWDCNLTTYAGIASPPPGKLDDTTKFLLEKKYDALRWSGAGLSNQWNGTCQEGQLIERGYAQELTNGQILREAYIYDSSKGRMWSSPSSSGTSADLHLLDVKQYESPWNDIYYRADDEQRTLLSGPLIIKGLFQGELDNYMAKYKRYPTIPVHTADYGRDIMEPNAAVCPRLAEIWDRALQSMEFRIFNGSREVRTLQRFQEKVLNLPRGINGNIDCLMTTICTDRPLPEGIDDFDGGDENPNQEVDKSWGDGEFGSDLFLRLYNWYVKQYTMAAMYNNGEYSKLAMGPLWMEIMENINATIAEQSEISNPSGGPSRKTPKLAIFAGHDSTLIPLLASLETVYDGAWPPYASMLLIEIHEINIDGRKNKDMYPSNYAFRLIYNGRVLTNRLEGCQPTGADLCDISHFLAIMAKVAVPDRKCTRLYAIPKTYQSTALEASHVLTSKMGLAVFLLIVLTSAAAGAIGALFLLSRTGGGENNVAALSPLNLSAALNRQRRTYVKTSRGDEEEEEDGIALTRVRGNAEYSDSDVGPGDEGNDGGLSWNNRSSRAAEAAMLD